MEVKKSKSSSFIEHVTVCILSVCLLPFVINIHLLCERFSKKSK